MKSFDETIRNLTAESDISFQSDVYEEINSELTDRGLNMAFFVFTTGGHSAYARKLNGNTLVCPVLALYLKYDADFQETGIDPHHGNWGDEWQQTCTVRDSLNTVLQRHDYGNDYVSEDTFIFVNTFEEVAFREIGRGCKDAVRKLICDEAPGVEVSRVFWNGHQYDVIMRDEADYKRVKRNVKTKVTKAIPKILAAADKEGRCQVYKATIEFGYTGLNLFHLIREDCC